MVNHELDHNPRAQFSLEQLSLALAVSPRTLQLHLKKELLASPREVWLQLQAEH
jgi:AraC-like DNA-binding protein